MAFKIKFQKFVNLGKQREGLARFSGYCFDGNFYEMNARIVKRL